MPPVLRNSTDRRVVRMRELEEELAALQTLTETTRAGPKPSDGRYEFPLMDKLEIHTIAGLTKYAIRHGLTTTDRHRPR